MGKTDKKIAFLINPASGNAAVRKKGKEMATAVKGMQGFSLYETKSPEELIELTGELAKKNYRAVFACGGDGTLNLVSSQLTGTETAMGIIPLGSGNGYARHHHISLKWQDALKAAENPIVSVRDTALFNGYHFLNIAGVGYTAKISHEFKREEHRGLRGYIKTVFKNLKMDAFDTRITNEHGQWEGKAWMVDFCNGSQWGNNFRVDPSARDDDGTISAVVFRKSSPIKIPVIGFRLAAGSIDKSSDVYRISGSKFIMEFEGKRPLHLDGEAAAIIEKIAEIEVVPKSLIVWTPG
ncbi:MAG: diacylglycerol/lipid kinase family protein [Sphingomonadales bacterium]|jgi:diacylglycerol kinase (ATP)